MVEGMNPPRQQPSQRFVPTCCHCDRVCRPHCCLLRSRAPKKDITPPKTDMENLGSKMRNFVLRLDKLEGGRTIPEGIGLRK
jgi:hypothetical protein